MSKKHIAIVAFVILAALPGAALADRDATAQETARVVSALKALGYTSVSDVDVVGDRFVVDARSPKGQDVDVILDKETLRIISEERS